MGIGDLILFGIIGFILYKMMNAKKTTENQDSEEGEFQLTEVQKEWRRKRAMEKMSQEHQGLHEQADVILQQNQYILDNIRPFNFYEWLAWAVQPELFQFYLSVTLPMFLIGTFGPLFFGFAPLFFVVAPVVLFYDIRAYKQMRICEVTIWNDEWHKKFGND